MNRLFFAIYTWGIHAGNLLIFLGSFFSNKIRLMYQGRKNTLANIHKNQTLQTGFIWVHCASLGEFEQGRPLIEAIKRKYPDEKILLSFFSPSGYEIRKNYTYADEIIYLPSDLPQNNQKLLDYYKPKAVILIKYEFWWNLIRAIEMRKIPLFLVSGVFREGDYFLKQAMRPLRHLLSNFDVLFVQDEVSASILKKHHFPNHIVVAGDTRIDRVLENLQDPIVPEAIKNRIIDKKVIVYGSVWSSDMHIVASMVRAFPDFAHIVAPHNIESQHIKQLQLQLPGACDLYATGLHTSNILIIDNIGMLAGLYAVSDIVYIGGGFGQGIHNILEPTVFGVPVFFGPKYKRFNEAVHLMEADAAFSVLKGETMVQWTERLMVDEAYRLEISNRVKHYFDQNRGATEKILGYLAKILND
ncbi:MAG: 3-deoxy-D-manno-octulosonic acid transferase [Chitinophagales bacterium]|nr:3-deoxy-D-manno-octulosonic acid transferase [Chitinophagales bacterium]